MPAGLDGNPDPITSPERDEVLDRLAELVLERRVPGRPFLVGVDGIDGSGKSTFADELTQRLARRGTHVVRSTIDSFHQPREVRRRRGPTSPVGFYLDSHQLDRLRAELLEPFRAGPGNTVATAIFDEPTDSPVDDVHHTVAADDVLVFDGIFLQRPELQGFWDLTVFLDGAQRVQMQRLELVLRDLPERSVDAVAHTLDWVAKIDRYASGMRYYVDSVDPARRADVLIDNNDLARPRLLRP